MTADGEFTLVELFELFGFLNEPEDTTSPRAGVNPFSGRSARKPAGRPKGSVSKATVAIREAVLALQDEYDEMTVRQAFYALTVRRVIEKKEAGYRQVQRQILAMRREGVLPWEFITDGTRWVHAPETWDSTDDALKQVARTYRRNLWRSQNVRLEFWLEKDALASIVSEITFAWDVRLMVSRGQLSETYCYRAAKEAERAAREAGVQTFVYLLYDSDKSGRTAAEKIAEKLNTYSDFPIISELLAVTVDQIQTWDLPTRPAKEKGEPDAVELDAIPPNDLKDLVEDAIKSHIDVDAWQIEQQYEASERQILEQMVGGDE